MNVVMMGPPTRTVDNLNFNATRVTRRASTHSSAWLTLCAATRAAMCSRRLLTLSCLAASARAGANISFYISSSSGDDGAPGTSPAAPWRTLAHASSALSGGAVPPNSSLSLLRGDVFTLPTGVSFGSLTSFTFTSFGALSSRPVLLRPPASTTGPTLTIDNSSSVSVQGLEFRGGEIGVAFTYAAGGVGASEFAGVGVSDCHFEGIRGLAYNASSGSWWGAAVALTAGRGGVVVRDVNVVGNIVNGSDTFFKNEVPWSPRLWTRVALSGVTIARNAVTRNGYNVLFLDTVSHVSVTDNVFLGNTPLELFVAGTTDVIMGTLNASVSLSGNEFSRRGEFQPGGPDGCAIDFETNATGVSFVDNYVSRAFGAGVMVFGHVDGSNTGLVLERNRFLFNGCNQTRDDHGGIAFMRPGSSGSLSSNTMATCAGVALLNDKNDPGLPGWAVENNTVDGTAGVTLVVAAPPDVATAPQADGGLLVTASPHASSTAVELRFTMDGSRPNADSPVFPESGFLLPAAWRSVAIFVKAFPLGGGGGGGVVYVESESAGGVFAPPPVPPVGGDADADADADAPIPCPSAACYTPASGTFNSSDFSAWLLGHAAATPVALRVAPGTYALPASSGRAHLVLPPLTATSLDFSGVTLVCADRALAGVYLSGWVASSLTGLALRYARPPSSSVAITAINATARTVDVVVEAGHPTDDYVAGTVASCNIFTAGSRLRKPLVQDVYVASVAPLGGGSAFRLSVDNAGQLDNVSVGDLLGCRVPGGGMTFTVDGATNCTFSNVALYGGPCFGFLESGGGGNAYMNASIRYPDAPPGAAHSPLLSTSADGFHSAGARVGPRIEGSTFEGMDDDGIAIHGGFMLVTDAEAAGGAAGGGRVWTTLHGAVHVGDRVLFYDTIFAPAPLPSAPSFAPTPFVVTAVSPAPPSYAPPFNVSHTMPSQKIPAQGGYQIISLAGPAPLPPALGFDFVAVNADAVGSHYVLRNNTIRNHRARGMLLKGSHGLVHGNVITNSSLGGIIITPELYWTEASFALNITVRANVITLTSSNLQSYGGIALGAVAPDGRLATAPGHVSVVIENNTVVDAGYAPIWLNAGGNVSVLGNRIITPFHASSPFNVPHCCLPLPSDQAIAVYAESVAGLRVEGNCVEPAPPGESVLDFLLNVTNCTGVWAGGVALC
jgi:hypothetical protein